MAVYDPFSNDLDPEQLRRQALMQQLGGQTQPTPRTGQPAQPTNSTMPVSPPVPAAGGSPAASPRPTGSPTSPYGAGGGFWNSQYEWDAPEGSPRVADLRIGDVSRLGGFNTNAWGTGERGSESAKNTFGRIASRYEPTEQGMQQLLADPDFMTFWPNAKRIDGDEIDFGDGVLNDVIKAFNKDTGIGENWAYQPDDGGGAMGGGMAAGGVSPAMTNIDALAESDVLAQILRQIQGLQGGEDPMQRDMLMELLSGRGGV